MLCVTYIPHSAVLDRFDTVRHAVLPLLTTLQSVFNDDIPIASGICKNSNYLHRHTLHATYNGKLYWLRTSRTHKHHNGSNLQDVYCVAPIECQFNLQFRLPSDHLDTFPSDPNTQSSGRI